MNTVILTGRVTKPIRSNVMENGTPVVNFTGAFEFGLLQKLVKIEGRDTLVYLPATSYIDCAAWAKDADDAAYLEAGQEVTVQLTSMMPQGRLYDAKDGNGPKVYADITARVTNVRPGAKSKGKTTNGSSPAAAPTVDEADLSEIPF